MVHPMKSPLSRRPTPLTAVPISSANPPLRVAEAGANAVESPARQMQQTIETRLAGSGEARWSARRTLGFLFLTNGLFWAGVALVVRAIL